MAGAAREARLGVIADRLLPGCIAAVGLAARHRAAAPVTALAVRYRDAQDGEAVCQVRHVFLAVLFVGVLFVDAVRVPHVAPATAQAATEALVPLHESRARLQTPSVMNAWQKAYKAL